jgi:hypothetical protein
LVSTKCTLVATKCAPKARKNTKGTLSDSKPEREYDVSREDCNIPPANDATPNGSVPTLRTLRTLKSLKTLVPAKTLLQAGLQAGGTCF